MRATMLAVSFTLGVLAMGAATAQDKKEEKKQAKEEPTEFKHGGHVFTERVTVKEWIVRQKMFLKPHEGVWAWRKEVKDKGLMIAIYGKTKPGADLEKGPGVFFVHPQPGSILTDAAGNEYLVESIEGSNPTVCWVKLAKAAPKKKR